MTAKQTRREAQVLRRMAEIENGLDEGGRLVREGDSWWIDASRCTRTARTLLLKGLIKEENPSDDYSYAYLTNWGHMALEDREFVSPYVYLAAGIEPPLEAKRLMDSDYEEATP